MTTETNNMITRTANKSRKLQYRYIYLHSEQLLSLKKNGFRFFLFKLYFLKNNSSLKYLIDGGMLINFNFQRLLRFLM